MSDTRIIRRIHTVVEIINGNPTITNYVLERDAEEEFESIVTEQLKTFPREEAESLLERAIVTKSYVWGKSGIEYTVKLMRTNLIG